MSASDKDKPHKASLVALYRLEFYRKKNNWQFKNSRHKKPVRKRVEKESDLNITYILDNCGDKQNSDVLNVAFIDADSDQVQHPSAAEARLSQPSTLSQQWQHPINIWPTPPAPAAGGSVSERLQNLRRAISQYGLEEADNEQNSLKEARPCVDGYAGPDVHVQEACGWGLQRCEQLADSRGVQPGLWSEELWSAQVNADLDLVDGAGSCEDAGCCDEGLRYWDPAACDLGMLGDEQRWLDVSVDSESEFVRGAHAAPHSSEVDLSLPEELSVPDVSSRTLLRLSSRQLLRAQQHCARVLTGLMLELEDRQRQKLCSAASCEPSYLELPTRDSGLYPPAPPPTQDRVLAGSHLLPPPPPPPHPTLAPGATGDAWPPLCNLRPASTGRGRGRLL